MSHAPFADISHENQGRPAFGVAWKSDQGTVVGVSYGQFVDGRWGTQLLVGRRMVPGRMFATVEEARESALGLVKTLGDFLFAEPPGEAPAEPPAAAPPSLDPADLIGAVSLFGAKPKGNA